MPWWVHALLAGVCGKILLCFYFTREFWGAVLPEGSTPQWEGGVATAHYVQRAPVQSVCIIFSGDAQELLYVCTLAHVFVALYACKFIALTL